MIGKEFTATLTGRNDQLGVDIFLKLEAVTVKQCVNLAKTYDHAQHCHIYNPTGRLVAAYHRDEATKEWKRGG